MKQVDAKEVFDLLASGKPEAAMILAQSLKDPAARQVYTSACRGFLRAAAADPRPTKLEIPGSSKMTIQPKFKVGQQVYSGSQEPFQGGAQIVTLVSKVYNPDEPGQPFIGWNFRWLDGEIGFSPEVELVGEIDELLEQTESYVVLEYLENYCGSKASMDCDEFEHRCDCSNKTVRVTDLVIPRCQPPLFEFLAQRYPKYMDNSYDATWLHDKTFRGVHTVINNIRILNISSGYEVSDAYKEFLEWTPKQSKRHQVKLREQKWKQDEKALHELAKQLGKRVI